MKKFPLSLVLVLMGFFCLTNLTSAQNLDYLDSTLVKKLLSIPYSKVDYEYVGPKTQDTIPLSLAIIRGNNVNSGPLSQVSAGFTKEYQFYWQNNHGNISFIEAEGMLFNIVPQHFYEQKFLDSFNIKRPEDGADLMVGRIDWSKYGQHYMRVSLQDSALSQNSCAMYALDYDAGDSALLLHIIQGEMLYFDTNEMNQFSALSEDTLYTKKNQFPRGAYLMKIPKDSKSDLPGKSGGLVFTTGQNSERVLVGIYNDSLQFVFPNPEEPSNPIIVDFAAITRVYRKDFEHYLKK